MPLNNSPQPITSAKLLSKTKLLSDYKKQNLCSNHFQLLNCFRIEVQYITSQKGSELSKVIKYSDKISQKTSSQLKSEGILKSTKPVLDIVYCSRLLYLTTVLFDPHKTSQTKPNLMRKCTIVGYDEDIK